MSNSERALSVFVVDDYPDTAQSTATLLTLLGHRVRTALDAGEALWAATADQPDVVLLDICLRGLDGCELARRLAARKTGRPPLVVALSTYATVATRARAAACGVHLFLVKPVDPALLVGMMRRFQESLTPQIPPIPGSATAGPVAETFCHA